MIPNTTQTPNIIFNGLMRKMNDTDLRVVLLVVRATLGWEANKETGMRKVEDWISSRQLKEKTGRQSGALSKAIDKCVKEGWIEARDKNGNLLDTKGKRKGKNIYFRLGKSILLTSSESEDVVVKDEKDYSTSSESEDVESSTSSESANAESANAESEDYKRNPLQKKPFTKDNSKQYIYNNIPTVLSISEKNLKNENENEINQILDIFYKTINPAINYKNISERKATNWFLEKYGFEKTKHTCEYAISIQGEKYSPTITTPFQLKNNLGKLIVYYKREKNLKWKIIEI